MEENPYLAQVAKESGLQKKDVDSDNPYIKQAQRESGKPLEYNVSNGGGFMSGLSLAASTINVTNRYPDALANYAKYDVGLSPFGEDWNEIRARNQGVGEKLGRGLLKMGATMAGAVAENTIGVFSGLASMASGGTYADNAVGRSVDEMNEWMSENFSHYYSQKEMDPDRAWYESLGSANFWTDKFANGLGYSLGSLATVWLTGGEGLIAKGVSMAGKGMATLGEAAAVGKIATTGEKLKKIYETSKMIKTGAKLSEDVARSAKIARGLNAAKHLEVGAMMSLAESSVEAREKSKGFIQEQFAAWEEANPGKSAQQDMTAEEKQAILDSARAVENSTFVMNMGVLMPTNLLMFGSMIGGSKKLAGIPVGEGLTDDITKEAGKYVLKTPNTAFGKTLAKVNKFASPVYKNSLNEAFQEGAQFAIGVGASEYYKNKFDTGSTDITQAISKGLTETFGSADGIESMLLGALIGGGMGITSTSFGAEASKRKNKAANTERLLNIMNSESFTNIAANAEQNDEALRTISAISLANQVGNYKLANELRKQLIALRAGKLQSLDAEDLALEEFDDLEKMSEEEFMKRTGYDTTKTPDGQLKSTFAEQSGGKSHVQVIQDLKEDYKKAAKLNRDLDAIIQRINPIKTGLSGMVQSKEAKKADAVQRQYNQRLKNILMQHMVGIETRDEEINASIEELRKLSPEGQDSFANISKDDILALVKKNKITISPSGEIQFPKSVVSTTITDTDTEKEIADKKAKAQSSEGQREKKEEDEDNKVISKLDKALKYAQNLNPIAKMKFENELNNLFTGLQMREESIAAFEELMTSPEKRDLAILARQSAKVEAKIKNDNRDASVVIDEARSTADLDALINNDTLSPELRERLLKKYKELEEVEDAYAEKFDILSDENLKDMLAGIDEIKEADPQKAIAILRVIEARSGETKAQKEARANNQTEKQRKAKEAAEAAVAGFTGPEMGTPNSKPYVNDIRITTSDNRNIIINGVPYRNDAIDLVSAIQVGDVRDDGEFPLVSVTLTNKDGQVVKFTVEKDPVLAMEIAEIIMIGYVSEGNVDTVNMTKEEAEDRANNILKVSKKGEAALEVKTDIDPLSATPAIYEYAAKQLQKFLDGLFEAKKLLEDAYKRDNQPESALKALESYQTLVQMLEKYTKKLEEIQRAHRQMVGMPTAGDPDTKVGEMDRQSSVEIDNEINSLKAEADTIESKLHRIQEKIKNYQRLQDPTYIVAEAPSVEKLQEMIDNLSKDAEELTTELNLINTQIFKLTEQSKAAKENEARESSATSQEVQTPQGTEEPTSEQGDRPEAEGDVQVPTSEELDINAEEEETGDEIIFGSEGFNSADLFEEEEEDDIDIQSDFQQEEEEEDTEGTIDEDTVVRETTTPIIDEEETPVNENAGEIDARLVKNEYQTTDDYNNIVVSSDGTPLNNEDYYGNGKKPGEPGYKEGVKQKNLKGELIEIDPRVLSSHIDSPQGSEIEFEVRPDTVFWEQNKNSIPANKHWENIPIFVRVKTPDGRLVRVGMLEGYNPNKPESNASRKDIYENFLKGKKVTSTIAGKRGIHNSQNIANAVTSEGEVFFYSPFKDGAMPTLAISSPERESGMAKWQVVFRGDNVAEEEDLPSFNSDRKHLGKVAMLVRTPLGGFKQLFLTTKRLTQAGVNAAKLALINNQADILRDLIGFNKVAEMAVALNRTDMLFAVPVGKGEQQEDTYIFYHPKAESYIRISASNLSRAIKKQNFLYQFVKAKVGEKGGVDFVKDETKNKLHVTLQDGVVPAFEAAVLNRRYQVDGNRLINNSEFESPFMDPETGERKKYDRYTDYLNDPKAIPDIDAEEYSHTGILGSDMYLNEDGSPYFDIGITYGPMLVDGKKLNNNEENVSNQSANAKIKPEEDVEEDDEYSDDNDDTNELGEEEDDDSNNIFDAINGDEEVEEEEEDETTGSTTSFEDLMRAKGAETAEGAEAAADEEAQQQKAQMDEEDSGLLDPLVSRLEDIRANEFKGMFVDPVTGEETHYKIQPKGEPSPKKFTRISNISSEPFNGTKEVKEASTRAGNTVHDIVESVLMGRTNFTRGNKMSRVAFLELISEIGDIKKLITSRKETVIATEMIVYTDSFGDYAGKFDILVRRKPKPGVGPQYYLYDIKTGSEAGLANYEKGYTDPQTKKVSRSKRDQHGTQLSMYAYSLVGVGKLRPANIAGGSVLYIPVRYNNEGYIEKVSGMAEKKFTLNFNIKNLLKGEVSFEQKKTTTSSDPSIANAGKKKGSTKATTKSKTPKGIEIEPKEGKKGEKYVKDAVGKGATTLDAGLKFAILSDAIDAAGIVKLYEGQNKTITLEEAQELMNKVIKENC